MRHDERDTLARAALQVDRDGLHLRVRDAPAVDTARSLTPRRIDVAPCGGDRFHRLDAWSANVGAAARVFVLRFFRKQRAREGQQDLVHRLHFIARKLLRHQIRHLQVRNLAALVLTCASGLGNGLARERRLDEFIHEVAPFFAENRKSTYFIGSTS